MLRFLSTCDLSNDEVESLPRLWGGHRRPSAAVSKKNADASHRLCERRRCAASSGSGGRGGRDERSSLSGAPSTASVVAPTTRPARMKNLGIADAKHRRPFEERRPEAAFAPSPPQAGGGIRKRRADRSFSCAIALPVYRALGRGAEARQGAYRALFRGALESAFAKQGQRV